MSFGFSAGDFIAAATLIKNLVSALRSSSSSEYRELILELHGLQRALDEIEHLECLPEQQASLNAVKAAALMCHFPLSEFSAFVEKYQSLDPTSRAAGDGGPQLWRKKVQWSFSMEQDVQKLRAYLAAHVGSLNMRLMTMNFKSVNGLAQDNVIQRNALSEVQASSRHLKNLIQSFLMPQIDLLLSLIGKVWTTNIKIIDMLIKLNDKISEPDTRHTYLQQPVRVEDGLGRLLIIPSEWDMGMLDAMIRYQFREGPGSDKVKSEEYDFYNSRDMTRPISSDSSERLVPGIHLIMAFIIGLYEPRNLIRCPRPGCASKDFTRHRNGGKDCSECQVWFHVTENTIPQPFRLPPNHDAFKNIRTERKWFKNVQICPSDPAEVIQNSKIADMTSTTTQQVATVFRPEHEVLDDAFAYLSGMVTSEHVMMRAILSISEITGLSISELQEACKEENKLSAWGVDSLMSLWIYSELRQLGLYPTDDIPSSYTLQEDLSNMVAALVLGFGDETEAYQAKQETYPFSTTNVISR